MVVAEGLDVAVNAVVERIAVYGFAANAVASATEKNAARKGARSADADVGLKEHARTADLTKNYEIRTKNYEF